jgi:signal transduction histidine kinase/ActR/RegA family two-component response regulator
MKDDGWATVLDPAELPRVLERFKASIESGMPWDDTFPIRARDGQFRWHLSRALPLRDKNGEIQIWFGTNTDVTEQRRLAEERKELLEGERAARTEAERASRLKDDFLATLSHELRTPLNAILGWSQLLEQGGGGTAEVQEGLSAIARNARIQTQLIEDLLDMSRILTGKFRLDVRPLRLEEVIDKAIESVMPAALAKEIRIEKILDTAAGPMLGDAARLQQAVWNLVSNSVKFTPRSGRVQVILRRVSSHVEIVVSDTGAGIAPEFLPYVFDRFRQADASTTRRTGGLGLGLAIVKQIAELHGGSVSATSRGANAGSTFAICLPVSLAQPRDAVDPDADAADLDRSEYRPKLDGLTVLVVDDEPDARQLARRILEEYGAKVQTAASANEALTSLLQRRPDVMISDIGMPEMDGYELMRRVRGLPADQGGQVPAAALTAFARSEDRRRALMAGYQSHVVKPVDTLELATVVASLAGRTARQR